MKGIWIILPKEAPSALLNIFGFYKVPVLEILNQIVQLPLLIEKQVSLTIKREDLLDPYISGNKFRKLKYNLLQAKKEGHSTLLTFGGAYSNHIAATAYAGFKNKLSTIGVIRGEELSASWQENKTLKFAHENGMKFKFIPRNAYRKKEESGLLGELEEEFGLFYLLPEGGTNALAIAGCEEILQSTDSNFEVVCCAVGTGGTISGIINASNEAQSVLGFPALKGNFLNRDICKFVRKENWELLSDYHFGGYAKVSEELINFVNDFYMKTEIPLDPIYTGKMIFGIMDLIKKDYFPRNSKILAIHTGGLQGIAGMNQKLKKKNLPLLSIC